MFRYEKLTPPIIVSKDKPETWPIDAGLVHDKVTPPEPLNKDGEIVPNNPLFPNREAPITVFSWPEQY